MAIPLDQLSGKTAIVTGAGAGINLCFAELLLKHKVNVVICDLQLRPESQALLDQHKASPKAIFQPTNVTVWTDLERMFTTCESNFGSADIVVPGAGVYEPLFSNFWIPPGTSPSRDSPTGNTYASLDINVTHPIRTTQLAISHFLKHNKAGSIVHLSSIAGQASGLFCPLYFASKHAVSAFVRSLKLLETPLAPSVNDAKNMQPLPKIRVTAVAPGLVRTPLWLDNPEKLKWISEGIDSWISPEEVADRMLELVTSEHYVGGTILEVGKGTSRVVPEFMNPGPSGPGMASSNRGDGRAEVWDRLMGGGWGEVASEPSVTGSVGAEVFQ